MRTKGVLFFCMNNSLVDYSKLTRLATHLVHCNLGLPVAVVTDIQGLHVGQDYTVYATGASKTLRYFHEYETTAEWNNAGRERSLDYTPFDTTVVLDVDYLCFSNRLLTYTSLDLGVPKEILNLGSSSADSYCLGNTYIPHFWASVMVFQKDSPVAKKFFRAYQTVRDNWPYYAHQFDLSLSLYRNDYVSTVAALVSDTYDYATTYADPVLNLTAKSRIQQLTDSGLIVSGPDGLSLRTVTRDIHVSDKKELAHAASLSYGY